MGRRQSINREAILEAAERVIGRAGATGLTIDAVAREAGVSKGGVQYCYGSKDALIKAMIDRVTRSFDENVDRYLADNPDETLAPVRAHIEATRAEDRENTARSSALLASLIRAPGYQDEIRDNYRGVFEGVDMTTRAGRLACVALLAAEGAFLLRGLGLHDMDDITWDGIFDEIRGLLV